MPQQQPQHTFNHRNSPNFRPTYQPPARPQHPRPFGLPRPEPMDVDRSLHSKVVNYMNRNAPNNQAWKRPSNLSQQVPFKQQRNFHIETGTEGPYFQQATYDQQYPYDQQYQHDEQNLNSTEQEYETMLDNEQIEQLVQEQSEHNQPDYIDVNFLG